MAAELGLTMMDHNSEKWKPIFGQDHAQNKNLDRDRAEQVGINLAREMLVMDICVILERRCRILSIKHVTTYRYLRPVAFGEHRMMLRPRDDDDQKVLQSQLEITPKPRELAGVGIGSAITSRSRISPTVRTSCALSVPLS